MNQHEQQAVFEYEPIAENTILWIRIVGDYDADMSSERIIEIVEQMNKHNCNKAVLDYRKGNIKASTMTIYERPQVSEQSKLARHWKIATVFKKITSESKFAENVYRNRGYNHKFFEDFDAAINWLQHNID